MTPEEQQTYEQLIERHRSQIEHLCMHRALNDYHLCAELRQECYISIWKHLSNLRPDSTPKQESRWVYWQCRSAFSRQRFLCRAQLVSLDEEMERRHGELGVAADSTEPDPYGGLDLEPYAELLSPHEFRALQLMAEGYAPDEMASLLGIKPRSAIQLRYRITAKLRKYHQPKK